MLSLLRTLEPDVGDLLRRVLLSGEKTWVGCVP